MSLTRKTLHWNSAVGSTACFILLFYCYYLLFIIIYYPFTLQIVLLRSLNLRWYLGNFACLY